MTEQHQTDDVPNAIKPSISVFFPAFNDGGTIPSMVLTALMTLRELADDYEVIVVNDGSSDYTADVLEELASRYPELRVIHHPQNRGYGGALRTGFQSATRDLIFYTDGDAQYDPREMTRLYEAWSDQIDFVNGYKISRSDPLHRILIGRIYHWTVKLAFGLHLRDVDGDFRLMRRSIFDAVQLESDSGVICVELMKKAQDAGFRIAEVPVHHFHRPENRKRIDIGDYYGDYRKIRSKLGWCPPISLQEGLRRSLQYYREHGSYYWEEE